ncbi:MAG: YfiT family bacillithiol transferase [Chitinophagaceae bacterium]
MNNEELLRYPIGKLTHQQFTGKEPYDEKIKEFHLRDIGNLPLLLEYSVQNLDAGQLEIPYRPGGWTIQQVIHHMPDSHMNAYMRFKLALTEEMPTIKPYEEGAWANLSDTKNVPINVSLTLLHALHTRWVELMGNMMEDDWQKKLIHPQHNKEITLWSMLATYSWHGKHHLAHITSLRDRMGW